jgi:putative oxygen-independent coproporphyrinogen III oxidase
MRGLYIHFPYCRRLCPYCNFNKYLDTSAVASQAPQARLADAFAREIASWSKILDNVRQPITSIFFGGGSPSSADVKFHDVVLSAVRSNFAVDSDDCEVTIEVNPTDVEVEKLRDLRNVGFNRISLGVQSFDNDDLQTLGRNHRRGEAIRAVESAVTKFDRVSVDIMYGLPSHRDAERFGRLLDESLRIVGPVSHLSTYALTIEEGTPFHQAQQRGDLVLPTDDESADMYANLRASLAGAGFAQYEISNFARDGHFARHNWNFWKGGEVRC